VTVRMRKNAKLHRHVFKPSPKTSANVTGPRPHDVSSTMVRLMNAGRPMELLQNSIGAQVLVELKGRKQIKGRLRGYDQHLNLVLEDAEEISFNAETGEQTVTQIANVIVRGDNVVIVSPPPKQGKKKKE
jgi:small nuclear ribonucleoprotein